jgi:peptidoglycan/xylan/chitin deacetylase (PgdA/CDA1 family)
VLILYYHNVLPGALDEFDRRLSRIHVAEFARQMEHLAANYSPVSLAVLLARLRAGEYDPRAVAVTFDDGYYGVKAHALPVLRRFRIPATIFVVTDFVRDPAAPRLLHFDEIEIAFRLTEAPALDLGLMGGGFARLAAAGERVECMKRVKRHLKQLPERERQRLQRALLRQLAVGPEEALAYAQTEEKYRTLSWDELRASSGEDFAVGSHTRSHRVLSRLEPDELESEIVGACERLRAELELDDVPFAYPYGGPEQIGDDAARLVREAGHTCGLTTVPGTNRPPADPFRLRRLEFEMLQWLAARRPEHSAGARV